MAEQEDEKYLFLHAVHGLTGFQQDTYDSLSLGEFPPRVKRPMRGKKSQAKGKAKAYAEPVVRLGEEQTFVQAFTRAPEPSQRIKHKALEEGAFKKARKQEPDPTDNLSMQELLDAQYKRSVGQGSESMDAFFKAMKDVQPLTQKGRDIAPEVQLSATPDQGHDAFALMMEKKLEFSLALKGEYIEGHVVGLDELTMNNLRAGVYSPEAHLDMHGLNAMQAYQALVGFFRGSWYKGMRTLLLIPGRGKNSPNGVSVLREKVQLWLTQEPFKRVVLAFCTAQPLDGGPGTLYVLLRKYKKKGKVCWERMPSDPDLY